VLIKQNPYQALKGRNLGMGYGFRPFRAYGMGGIFIVGRCPTQGDCALSGLLGMGKIMAIRLISHWNKSIKT